MVTPTEQAHQQIREDLRDGVRKLPKTYQPDGVSGYLEYMLDPRPHFSEDHELWRDLLARAYLEGPDLHAALHCLRCGGARVEWEDDTLTFEPRHIDPNENPERGTAWEDRSDWELDTDDLLTPHKHTLKRIASAMKQTREQHDESRREAPA